MFLTHLGYFQKFQGNKSLHNYIGFDRASRLPGNVRTSRLPGNVQIINSFTKF
jgi:hypothetical protein